MKQKLLIFTILMLSSKLVFSQIEVKTNPIGALFGIVPLSVEYIATENIGIEGTLGYSYAKGDLYDETNKASGLVLAGLFKYYFNPKNGGDRFYAFPYIRFAKRKFVFTYNNDDVTSTYTAFGAGFGIGYKWVAESGLLVDIGAGLGKNFTGKFTYDDPSYSEEEDLTIPINGIFRISIGYRF